LSLARERMPSAITLDIILPDVDGWRIIDSLRSDLATRHIPIWVVSTEDARERAFESGAQGFIAKPLLSAADLEENLRPLLASLDRRERRVLVVAPENAPDMDIVRSLASDGGILIEEAADMPAVINALEKAPIDCMVLDGRLDLPLFAVAEALRDHPP